LLEENKALASWWYSKAFTKYRNSAGQGDADALYMLGTCYDEGCGVTQDRV
jgi:TPR repeat protein